jgi:hypothetical protein
MNGDICEILIYTSSVSTTSRQQIEGYLASKWGIQRYLPTIHPYYSYLTTPTIPIAGYSIWMDAADATSVTVSGGKVTQWNDKSGNGYNFTQSTSGNRPSYITSGTNGLNVIRFGGNLVKHYLGGGTTLPVGLNDISMFAVIRFESTAINGSSYIFAKSLYGGYTGRLLFGLGSYGVEPYATSSNEDNYTTYHILEFVTNRAAGTTTIYSNGSQIYQSTGLDTTTNWTTNLNMIIGGYNNGSGTISPPMDGLYMVGDICEILLYTSSVSTSSRQQIEGYLAGKWGFQQNLPSNHPYFV